jgi:hypothetical protein
MKLLLPSTIEACTGGATWEPNAPPPPLVYNFFQCPFDSWYWAKNCCIGIGSYWASITDGLEQKEIVREPNSNNELSYVSMIWMDLSSSPTNSKA